MAVCNEINLWLLPLTQKKSITAKNAFHKELQKYVVVASHPSVNER